MLIWELRADVLGHRRLIGLPQLGNVSSERICDEPITIRRKPEIDVYYTNLANTPTSDSGLEGPAIFASGVLVRTLVVMRV